ncbi:MAG: PqqD family protein [Anaerolineae bacterium]
MNQPTVIGEVIDDEAIIVNLDSGAYYSLRGTGAAIWQMIEQGSTVAHMVEQLARHYATNAATIEAGVTALVTELQAEQLIVAVADGVQADAAPPAPLPPAPAGPFDAPVLEKYTDMADLLLLDPIHEVDETAGWPHPSPPAN